MAAIGTMLMADAMAAQSAKPSTQAKQHYARAQELLEMRDRRKALIELKAAIELSPEFIEAHRDYLDNRENDIDGLVQEYEAYVKQRPKSSVFHYLLGKAYAKAGSYDQSQAEFHQALKINPNFGWALLDLGEIESDKSPRRGEGPNKAIQYWEQARRHAGNSVTLRYELAKKLIFVKKHESALEEAVLVLKTDPLYFAAYPVKWRAQMILMSGADRTAARVSREIQQLETRHARNIRALEAVLDGYDILVDKEGMTRTRRAILVVDPKHFEEQQHSTIYSIGSKGRGIKFGGANADRLIKAKQLKDAKEQLAVYNQLEKEIEDADIKLYILYPAMFSSYLRLSDLENGERLFAMFEKGEVDTARLSEFRIELAQAYLEQRTKLDAALDHLQRAFTPIRDRIAQFEQNEGTKQLATFYKVSLANGLHTQGQIFLLKGLTQEAIGSLVESVKLSEQEGNMLDLGLAYSKQGDVDNAIKLFITAYSFEGARQQEARAALAQIYGEREKAKPLTDLLAESIAQKAPRVGANSEAKDSRLLSKREAKRATNFELQRVSSGEKIRLADLQGKVVLLTFWATWCAPCLREWPHLQLIQHEYKSKNLAVVMISIDEEQYRVPLFLKKNAPSSLILLTDYKIEQAYEVQGIPLTLIIDREGMIRYRHSDFEPGMEKALREVITSLISEP